MKTTRYWFIPIALLGLTACQSQFEECQTNSFEVTATAYNSLAYQTSSNPSITAFGDSIKPGMRYIAVSRDLLDSGLVHNTKVKLEGFDSGADDYLTKPFVMEELVYRVKAILKRTKQDEVDILQFRDIIIKQKSKEVIIDDKKIDLTKLEFNLLTEFIKNKNIVLTREYLLENVWGGDSIYQDRTVNVAIKRLKEKIDGSRNKNYIKSIRGEGYTIC